jgi:hypothetical protein
MISKNLKESAVKKRRFLSNELRAFYWVLLAGVEAGVWSGMEQTECSFYCFNRTV